MERKDTFIPSEFYHIYNRGIEKRLIFEEEKDWKRFQDLLYLCNSRIPLVFKSIQGDTLDYERGKGLVSVIAYSLMPNHFHLILREEQDGGISKFLTRISTAYSMYFNTKNKRSGGLFCRPFRAKHINNDEYFRWVISYIHLNPLDIFEPGWKLKGLKNAVVASDFLKDFAFSSYPDYFPGDRKEGVILERSALPMDISELEDMEAMLKIDRSFQGVTLER